MPNYRQDTQRNHMEMIRVCLTIEPNASDLKLQEMLRKQDLSLDYQYIQKLRKKLKGERKYRINTQQVDERISDIRDKVSLAQQKLWEVLASDRTTNKDKVSAAKAIADTEIKLFNAEMDAGIFERNLGTLAVDHGLDENDPSIQLIMQAFQNYGIVKKPKEIKTIEPKQLNADNRLPNNTKTSNPK